MGILEGEGFLGGGGGCVGPVCAGIRGGATTVVVEEVMGLLRGLPLLLLPGDDWYLLVMAVLLLWAASVAAIDIVGFGGILGLM